MNEPQASIAAVFPDTEVFANAVAALGAAGIERSGIRIACADNALQSKLVERLGVRPLSEPGSDRVETALHELEIPPSRARYFANALAGARVLAILPRVPDNPEILRVLAAYSPDFGPVNVREPDVREVRVPLREERAAVHTYQVEVGRVHVHREVTTEVARFEVELQREDIVVERIAPGSVSPEITRIPVSHEDVRVMKRTVVANEVRVRREQYRETRQVDVVLRRELPRIETTGEVSLHDD